jgi:cellulose synthase/poly-beta-1,6-N-acetylglucosamine synthase-like glycosyltransferase
VRAIVPAVVLISLLFGSARLVLAAAVALRRRRAPPLPPPLPPPPPAPPEVTVLLPVRDEEDNVLACLDSLFAQTALPAVRVIDDGSRDRTAELVAGRAAAEPRLSWLRAGPPPAGWRGKVHALWVGSRGVESPWLLLTDADTRHHPELLARALAAAQRPVRGGAGGGGLDAVSLAGSQAAEGWGENLLVPGVFALLDALLGSWEAAARGEGPPVANGQFLLLRRAACEQSGGFPAVRGEASDDVAIARLLAAHGFRTGFLRAPGLLRVRMYRGWTAAARGWRRNLGALLGPRPATAGAALAVLLLPAVGLAGCLAAGRLIAAALVWAAGVAASALLRAGSEHRPAYALLYPLDDLLLAGLLARSVLDFRRGRLAPWKGREMKL